MRLKQSRIEYYRFALAIGTKPAKPLVRFVYMPSILLFAELSNITHSNIFHAVVRFVLLHVICCR